MRNITEIIVHCSASDYFRDDNIAAIKNLHTSPKSTDIKWGNYDTHGKGFSDIGYHFFIDKSGAIIKGRTLARAGAHCTGKNRGTIGVCLSGNHKFTNHQYNSLRFVIKAMNAKFNKELKVNGHYKYSETKTCPNFNVTKFLEMYL